jgi:hypothetical protein
MDLEKYHRGIWMSEPRDRREPRIDHEQQKFDRMAVNKVRKGSTVRVNNAPFMHLAIPALIEDKLNGLVWDTVTTSIEDNIEQITFINGAATVACYEIMYNGLEWTLRDCTPTIIKSFLLFENSSFVLLEDDCKMKLEYV